MSEKINDPIWSGAEGDEGDKSRPSLLSKVHRIHASANGKVREYINTEAYDELVLKLKETKELLFQESAALGIANNGWRNAEIERDRLAEEVVKREGMDAGFWGRTCSRLQTKKEKLFEHADRLARILEISKSSIGGDWRLKRDDALDAYTSFKKENNL